MARRRKDRWLLMRLAAQNVGRRRLRAIFLGIAVMLGVGVAFASFIAGWSLRAGIATSFSRMGADLLVVRPRHLGEYYLEPPHSAADRGDIGRQLGGIFGRNCRGSEGGAAAYCAVAGRRTPCRADRV